MASGRLKIIYIPQERLEFAFRLLLTGKMPVHRYLSIRMAPHYDKCDVRQVLFCHDRMAFAVVLECDEFDEVPSGAMIPLLDDCGHMQQCEITNVRVPKLKWNKVGSFKTWVAKIRHFTYSIEMLDGGCGFNVVNEQSDETIKADLLVDAVSTAQDLFEKQLTAWLESENE